MYTDILRETLLQKGAIMVGYGDLSEIPSDIRHNMTMGVSVAVKFNNDVIESIIDHPTVEYMGQRNELDELLDDLVSTGAKILREQGYQAIAQTREEVDKQKEKHATILPHKTVATRAGIGWIGKCGLLVTEEYGSMVRISSILTDAPLPMADPISESRCGGCMEWQNHCPAKAIKGKTWTASTQLDDLFDIEACRKTSRELSQRYLHTGISLCGKCIISCPYTKRYLKTKNIDK